MSLEHHIQTGPVHKQDMRESLQGHLGKTAGNLIEDDTCRPGLLMSIQGAIGRFHIDTAEDDRPWHNLDQEHTWAFQMPMEDTLVDLFVAGKKLSSLSILIRLENYSRRVLHSFRVGRAHPKDRQRGRKRRSQYLCSCVRIVCCKRGLTDLLSRYLLTGSDICDDDANARGRGDWASVFVAEAAHSRTNRLLFND